MDVASILKATKKLSDEQYEQLVMELMEADRPVSVKKSIKKRIDRIATRLYSASDRDGGPLECDPSGGPSRSCNPLPSSSKNHPRERPNVERSRSAFKSPFIYRGDLTPTGDYVYMDVEKLSLKKSDGQKKHEEVASSVAVVNNERNVILWSFISWDNICQTFPSLTGITKEKLEIGLELSVVKPFVDMAFKGNVVVGWDLAHDLNALFVGPELQTLDLSNYFVDAEGQKLKLKDVWKLLCASGKDELQCGIHCAIQDARVTRDIHKKMIELQKKYPNATTCPLNIPRSKREPFKFDRNDICRCTKSRNNKPLQEKYFLPKDPQSSRKYTAE